MRQITKRLFVVLSSILRIFKEPTDNVDVVTAQGLEVRNPIEHNTEDRIDEFYSNSVIVDKYIDAQRVAFYKDLIKFCYEKGLLFEQNRVADVGCGTGHLLKFIGEKFDVMSLTGLEFSTAALTVAKTVCPAASFQKYDIYLKPSCFFDVVFCTEVLEHLLYPNKALRNCLELLASGGILILTVPDGRKDTFLGHINFWSPESWVIFIELQCKDFKYETGQLNDGSNYAFIWKEKNR